jgi:predicted AAA+ superfamily ATPase
MSNTVREEHPNKHILEFLEYYCDPTHDFDYAVMLTGPWGSGKTHLLVKEFLQKREESGTSKYLYVSLYGLSSFRQIEEAFYRKLHPILSSKGMKIAV